MYTRLTRLPRRHTKTFYLYTLLVIFYDRLIVILLQISTSLYTQLVISYNKLIVILLQVIKKSLNLYTKGITCQYIYTTHHELLESNSLYLNK